MEYRDETDAMGTVRVPSDAYWGSQTQRAVENFPISGLRMPREIVRALGLIKGCAAQVNGELGLLPENIGRAMEKAALEVADGTLDHQFPVDVFQTGSGTSTHMNANEVIAARANEMLTGKLGGKFPVHPNDHVNLGQSSNDAIPSAIHIAARLAIRSRLIPALEGLAAALTLKSEAFSDVRKIGRTHLQDAVPMTLGQEFSGYARQVEWAARRIADADRGLSDLAIGGTAVGTGLNAHPSFGRRMAEEISRRTGLTFQETDNHFQAQAAQDAVVSASGALRTLAVSLVKIANDVRWLASGPRCGIGEIRIPALQPGSSIMPGKVNPVIPEAVLQVAAQVMGNDAVIVLGGQGGNFELNVMLPVMSYNLMQSIRLLAAACKVFAEKCIDGIVADREACAAYVEKSLALATGLVPHIGYDRASALAKRAYTTGKTIGQAAREEKVLDEDLLTRILKG